MKTIAIILAGGTGSRFKADKPKQFVKIDGEPIIAHTIGNFQRSPRVDGIIVACIEKWIPDLQKIVKDYKLSKVQNIIPGGATGHDSTRNAIYSLKNTLNSDDIVIIHDAARPILPQVIIDKMLDVAIAKGNACTSLPCHETLVTTEDQVSGTDQIDRWKVMRIQTPQAYRYGTIKKCYEQADADNRHDFIYANTLAIHYGVRIFFSEGFDSNVKITTKEDTVLYKYLLSLSEDQLVK